MKRPLLVAAVAVAQLALVVVAVAPQLSARVTGETYEFAVAPIDPHDPFRGAYVDLDYPDLRPPDDWSTPSGTPDVYVVLEEKDGLMRATDWSWQRPAEGTYLSCSTSGGPFSCGIESWFADADEARRIEDAMRTDGAIAEVRIDGRGNAAIVSVRAR
ncbi:GDYXXLXY domain-containing protein [Nocardioides jishulii]|nr:GDYXXLXY domain-containing protein [Nocardioides jishulii]